MARSDSSARRAFLPVAHRPSSADRAFVRRFERGNVAPREFEHRAHLRLAYACLAAADVDAAHGRLRRMLRSFLRIHGIDPGRYHETLTGAWVRAVAYFMARTDPAASFDAFIATAPVLLDPAVMETHYTRARLLSDEARGTFLAPDLDPIPRT